MSDRQAQASARARGEPLRADRATPAAGAETRAAAPAPAPAARTRWRLPIAWLVVTPLCALLIVAYRLLDEVVNREVPNVRRHVVDEFTAIFGAALLFPLVRHVARRYPLQRDTWLANLPRHVAALLLFAVTLTSSNWITRVVIYRLLGFGWYDYGTMPTRYLMEFPIQVIMYTLFVSGVWLFDRSQAEREAALRAARLEAQLKQAQLHGLRLQLQPHFLFNALNTISSTMYDDPTAADTMLSRLAELLRVSLRTTQTQEVPLAAELEALDHYVALMRARFGDKLRLAVDVDEPLRQALVPSLILQPLVENAVRHGNLARIGAGRIDVRARRDDRDAGHEPRREAAREPGRLIVEVEDDGPGPDPGAGGGGPGDAGGATAESTGVGLSATRGRLRLLYGDDGRLTLRTAPARDRFTVRVELPLRLAEPD